MIIPTGIINNPNTINPGRMMYINKPRLVLPLLKIKEIKNNTIIRKRFSPAISAPIIVIQFLDEDGSFMVLDFGFQSE